MKGTVVLVAGALIMTLAACNSSKDKPNSMVQKSEEDLLRDAVAKHPDSILLREKLIQHLEDKDNIDGALSEMNKALARDSLNPRFWFKKGDLHMYDEDTASAKYAYQQSIAIFPEPAVIMTLASVYAQQGNDTALQLADALLIGQKAAANKEALFVKGLYYNYKGNKQKAISYLDDALKIDYMFMLAYREKTIALYDQGKYSEALSTIERAVTLQSTTFDEGYYWMGRCYEKLNKFNDAVESYRAALTINPNYMEAEEALRKLSVN